MTNGIAAIPGWLKSPEAAKYLGVTESQFRKIHPQIKSIQLHKNGPRFFREEDVHAFLVNESHGGDNEEKKKLH